jgi:hypothetical protein
MAVLDRVSEQLRTALRAAQEAARGLGHQSIDTCDLLIGLVSTSGGVAERALAKAGVSEAVLREYTDRHRRAGSSEPTTQALPLAADVKSVVELMLREAFAAGHTNMTTGHALLAVLARPECAGAVALQALGVDPVTCRDGVHHQHGVGGTVERVMDAHQSLAGVDQDAPPRLPGRASLVCGILLRLAWYAAAAAAVLSLVWDEVGPETIIPFLVLVPALAGLSGRLVGAGRPLRRLLATASGRVVMPAPYERLLTRHGLASVDIHLESGTRIHDRSYRVGRRAWIVLSPITLGSRRALSFVFGHEIAHVLRYDSLRWIVDVALYAGLWCAALLTFDPRALGIVAVSVVAHRLVTRWWVELACDALSVRWFGAEALHAWATHQAALRAASRKGIRRQLRRFGDLFTHPPMAVRLARQPLRG